MDIYDLMKQVNDAFNQRYCFSSKRKNSKRYGLTILDNSNLSISSTMPKQGVFKKRKMYSKNDRVFAKFYRCFQKTKGVCILY